MTNMPMQQSQNLKTIKTYSSNRGGEKASYGGYLYNKDKSKGANTYWRCVNRQCKGRLTTIGLLVVKEVAHCHEVNEEIVRMASFHSKIKQTSNSSPATSAAVMSDVLRSASTYELPSLFKKKSVYKNIQNFRKKKYSEINFCNYNDEIPEFLKFTLNGEQFLKSDESIDNERFIILSTRENLAHLGNSKIWMCDGTFFTCPNGFYQLFTIFGSVNDNYYPLVYCLLSSKTTKLYTKVLEKIKSFLTKVNLIYVITDFESAIKTSFESVFSNIHVYFCYFHFCQSLFRKFTILGFKKLYEENGEIRRFFKCITALAFVPENSVIIEYQKVKEIYTNCLNINITQFLEYFEKTYLFSDCFSYLSWNCYKRTIENIPITNNMLEGYHNGLKSVFLTAHPTITKFLYEIRCKQHLIETNILENFTGKIIIKLDKKKKS